LRSRRKKESITLQKLWKIKRALSLAATTTDIDPRADISLGLARAACVASYNDLLGATTTAIERRTHAIQQEIQSLYPVEPFYVQYLHFIETSIPVIEQTRLGKAALSYVLDHVDIEETGLWLEFGVSKGTTLSRIAQRAAVTTATTTTTTKQVYGFDSFQGLPTAWRVGFDVGKFNRNGIPPSLPETNIQYQTGWFEHTLPTFLSTHPKTPCSLIHIDCDVYSSAACVLNLLIQDNRIVHGTVIVFDELLNYNGFERHEMRALFEMLSRLNKDTPGKEGTTHEQHKEDSSSSTVPGAAWGKYNIEWIGSKHQGCMSVALKIIDGAI
jgi:hypothetical protein